MTTSRPKVMSRVLNIGARTIRFRTALHQVAEREHDSMPYGQSQERIDAEPA